MIKTDAILEYQGDMNLFRCNNAKKQGSRLLVDDKLSRMLNYSLRMEYKDGGHNLFSNGSLGQEVVNLFAEGVME